ncbi:DUF934 domain-containing protein [Rhodovulum marinum]|uniref:Uncharacterized protein (DUF934 family) n=1 Tax=Rhodovulum marinum TaxID=320662 RepID=A0A4R2PWA4_9RHOB|nr:DUF934 domain-containing protein [Rhodovulum marinum]TCP40403.1 uncharacterized protein (DUF934 family) [Rhodovulum marinum]
MTGPGDTVLVTDAGIAPAGPGDCFVPLADLDPGAPRCVDLAPGDDPAALAGLLPRIAAIRIAFPVFSDGRGFTLARELRRMGFRGRLRAAGHLVADQYPMARACGFDEVEIAAALAARQTGADWRRAARRGAGGYLDRLKAAP